MYEKKYRVFQLLIIRDMSLHLEKWNDFVKQLSDFDKQETRQKRIKSINPVAQFIDVAINFLVSITPFVPIKRIPVKFYFWLNSLGNREDRINLGILWRESATMVDV